MPDKHKDVREVYDWGGGGHKSSSIAMEVHCVCDCSLFEVFNRVMVSVTAVDLRCSIG